MEKLILYLSQIEGLPAELYMKKARFYAKELFPSATDIELCKMLSYCKQKGR